MMLGFYVCAGGLNSGPNVCVQALCLVHLFTSQFFFVLFYILFCFVVKLSLLPKLAEMQALPASDSYILG